MDSFIRNAASVLGFDEVYYVREAGQRRWYANVGCSWLAVGYWTIEVEVSRGGRISTKEISKPY